METIPAVAGNQPYIISAEFIKATVFNDVNDPTDVTITTFSSSYKAETIDGYVYSPIGGLLSVGVQQRDLSVTSASTSLTVSGLGPENIYLVLEEKIKGAKLEIWRGFYDDNQVLNTTSSPPVKRYSGIVTSYNITEERAGQDDNFLVTINASSYKLVLQNKTSGRRTNPNSWTQFFPDDTSMNNINSLTGRKFDFGMTPTVHDVTPPGGSTVSTPYVFVNEGGYGP